MASFPERAKVVIIGQGGIVGASVAHHLIERGWDDIVGIDKSAIPTDVGSTAHASDFCFNTMHDQMTIFTTKYSIDFYDRMGRYERIGGLEVARATDGHTVRGWPRSTGGATSSSPAVGDVNGDGHLDVVTGSRDGKVWAWK
ncbi:MAG TPA: FAD-dependent oxidoreductase, partial [Burkholderiaceae bacterium]|nr:FAD-dependent oxidoreductase [Burkholderiaceae bacterium]